MYLQRLQIQGFKSFASRVDLTFAAGDASQRGMTAIVGPNGSGKSNVADAVRWVLGEQSMKLLRGKKSADVIFAGSGKKAQLGMAEVSLFLNNEDKTADVDFSEIVITRRLYRNGDSEYLINKNKARLQDVQLLLARAHFGQRTYSVIGQGMIEGFLNTSPAEKKEFFDEAAGVRQYQIKRDQAINKFKLSREHLAQTQLLLNELEPRLRSLARHMKRLEQREQIEQELNQLQQQYYGQVWGQLQRQHKQLRQQETQQQLVVEQATTAVQAIRTQFDQLEQQQSQSQALTQLQKDYDGLMAKKNDLQSKELKFKERLLHVAAQNQKQQVATTVVHRWFTDVRKLIDAIDTALTQKDYSVLAQHVATVRQQVSELVDQTADKGTADQQAINQQLADIETSLQELDHGIVKIRTDIQNVGREEQNKKSAFFDLQRQLMGQQEQRNVQQMKLNQTRVELAKIETQRDAMEREMQEYLTTDMLAAVRATTATETVGADALQRVHSLRRQLEAIGELDQETITEYKTIKERFEYLQTQHTDLTEAIVKLEQVIVELDGTIAKQFDRSFRNIQEEFNKFFQILFNGGKAELRKINTATENAAAQKEEVDGPLDPHELAERDVAKMINSEDYDGVEVMAVPPGKKIKSIAMLSGGERALTSIALICAIIATNPSPFVVLDEVDAALDEANSQRFANILAQLSHHTQFIAISHNRYTMEQANTLYGVTMGDDGVSHLLSVNLQQAEEIRHQG